MKYQEISISNNYKQNKEKADIKKIILIVEAISIVVLLFHSLLIDKPPIFDEIFYIKDVILLNKLGISFEYLKLSETAAGPLTAAIHYLLQPFTNLEAPGIRIVNVVLLALTILVISILLRLLYSKKPLAHACSIIAIPMTWVISGMSLSEIPAMFCTSVSILMLLFAIDNEHKKSSVSANCNQKLLIAAIGGLFFSFSILGRQTFLVVEIALPILACFDRKNTRYIVTFAVVSLLLPLVTFITWGGLIPPSHLIKASYVGARSIVGQSSISLANGFLSFAYIGIATLIIAPRWFYFGKKTLLINLSILTATIAVNSHLKLVNITPMASIAKSIFSDRLLDFYSQTISGIILAIGFAFLVATFKIMWQKKQDYIFIFLCVSLLLVCGTSFKIVHQFSSRYVATAVPFLLLITEKYSTENYWKLARVIIGCLLGFVVLRSFFVVH